MSEDSFEVKTNPTEPTKLILIVVTFKHLPFIRKIRIIAEANLQIFKLIFTITIFITI